MNKTRLEEKLAALPLYTYYFFEPGQIEFSERIRYICEHECPMYAKTWACPPGVGSVVQCRERCLQYRTCLMIATITEVADISDIDETLSTRGEHECITNRVRDILREEGEEPYVLSSEACALCERCAYLDGKPCRFPEKMHPCVESHGINIVPVMEKAGLSFQFGENVVTWVSLLFL